MGALGFHSKSRGIRGCKMSGLNKVASMFLFWLNIVSLGHNVQIASYLTLRIMLAARGWAQSSRDSFSNPSKICLFKELHRAPSPWKSCPRPIHSLLHEFVTQPHHKEAPAGTSAWLLFVFTGASRSFLLCFLADLSAYSRFPVYALPYQPLETSL